MWKAAVLLIGLGINSLIDINKRQISLAVAGGMAACGIGFHLYEGNLICLNTLYALLPGIGCLIFSGVTGECLGYGDSYMILAMGFLLSASELMAAGFIALLCAGGTALIFLTVLKKDRKYELPFVPFLFAGYVILLINR